MLVDSRLILGLSFHPPEPGNGLQRVAKQLLLQQRPLVSPTRKTVRYKQYSLTPGHDHKMREKKKLNQGSILIATTRFTQHKFIIVMKVKASYVDSICPFYCM
jgi:hypothetical protein